MEEKNSNPVKKIERPYAEKLADMVNFLSNDIKEASTVFIAPHKRMDFDAIASSVAMAKLCNNMGKKAYIVTDDDILMMQVSMKELYTKLQKRANFIPSYIVPKMVEGAKEEELEELIKNRQLVETVLRCYYHSFGLDTFLKELPSDDMNELMSLKKEEDILSFLAKYRSIVLLAFQEMFKGTNGKELLITMDTNKRDLVAGHGILESISNVIVIDHHYQDEKSFETDKRLIDTTVSSASHIMTDILERMEVEIDPELAHALMTGIYLDTNRLLKKNSFEIAMTIAKLMKYGADANEVNRLFAIDDFETDRRNKKLIDKLIDDAVFQRYDIAIAMNADNPETLYEDDTILARVADDLLQYQNVAASFAIGFVDKAELGDGHKDKIAIKGRSNNKFDIASIMHYFGGGGEDGRGACTIYSDNIEGAKAALCMVLSQGFELIQSEEVEGKLLQLLPEMKR